MTTSHEQSMLLAEVLRICAKLGCDIRFVRSSSNGNGSITLHGVPTDYHKSVVQAVTEQTQSDSVLAKMSSFTVEEDLPMATDRREKIQDMLLERVEHLITQYDEKHKRDTVMGNADTLASIANVLQTIGYPARELTTFAAHPETPPAHQEPRA